MTSTYTRGEWYAVVDGATVALLDPAVEPDVVHAVWTAVAGGGGVPGVIRALTSAYGGDFAAIPAFAVVSPQRGGVLLAVRGAGRVHVRTADGAVDASGLEVTTWSERWVAEPRAVEVLASADAAAPGLPLRSGVVPAARVAMTLDDGPPPSARPLVSEEEQSDLSRSDQPSAFEAPAAGEEAPSAPVSLAKVAVSGRQLDETRAEVPDDGGYDHLWGHTVLRSVEEAARRGGEDPGHEDGPRGPATTSVVVPGQTPGPGAGPVNAEAPGIPDAYADDHDGQTIFRPRGAVPRPDASPAVAVPSAVGGPSVLARTCDQGHPNPPQAGQCSVCGQALGGDAVRVPRPALGRARLSSGDVLVLDAPAVLGRAPKTGRVAGPDVPRAVTVPSPTREVSGTHLAIRLEEWHVLVADLGSSNGTILRRPGQPPQRLHAREPALVFSGDVVDLGDGATVTFEDLP